MRQQVRVDPVGRIIDVEAFGYDGDQRTEVGSERAIPGLGVEVGDSARHGHARGTVGRDNRGRVQLELVECEPKVEEVAPFAPLIKRADLGRDKLGRLEGSDLGLGRPPRRAHGIRQ